MPTITVFIAAVSRTGFCAIRWKAFKLSCPSAEIDIVAYAGEKARHNRTISGITTAIKKYTDMIITGTYRHFPRSINLGRYPRPVTVTKRSVLRV
jgi:hypothetical protein